MPSTKLWLVTHVAIAMTARPIIEASSTRHANCSRMGIRILTMTLPLEALRTACGALNEGAEPRTPRVSVGYGAGELGDARDEAGGEGGGRCVSHSLRRVSGVRSERRGVRELGAGSWELGASSGTAGESGCWARRRAGAVWSECTTSLEELLAGYSGPRSAGETRKNEGREGRGRAAQNTVGVAA
jgi:hypothetical protein